jgi:hypothetical protein
VTYPGFTPVGNATLVVANVLTCNKHSQKKYVLYSTTGCHIHPPPPNTLSAAHLLPLTVIIRRHIHAWPGV